MISYESWLRENRRCRHLFPINLYHYKIKATWILKPDCQDSRFLYDTIQNMLLNNNASATPLLFVYYEKLINTFIRNLHAIGQHYRGLKFVLIHLCLLRTKATFDTWPLQWVDAKTSETRDSISMANRYHHTQHSDTILHRYCG